MPLNTKIDLSKLPPPPKGVMGMTLDQLPKPPTSGKGMTLDELNKKITSDKVVKTDFKSKSLVDTSAGGLPGFGKSVFDFFTSATQALGQNAGQAMASSGGTDNAGHHFGPDNITQYSDTLKSWGDMNNSLSQHIEMSKKAGKDTSKLEQALKLSNESKPQLEDFVGADTAKRMREDFVTNLEEVAGQGVGTVLEAMSGGIFEGGVKTAVSKELSLGQKLLKGAGIGTTYGAIGGASGAMQDKKGVGAVAVSTALGAGAGAILGAGAEAVGSALGKGISKLMENKKLDTTFENKAQKKMWSFIQPEIKDAAEAKATGRKVVEGTLKNEVLPNAIDMEKIKILENITTPNMNKTQIGEKAAERVNGLNKDVKAFILKNDKEVKIGDLQKEMFNSMQSDNAKRAVVFGNSTELEKSYESMINGFLGMTEGDTVKLSEIFNNRQEFDNLANKYIPKAFSTEARDTVKRVALRDIRDTANNFVVKNIEGGKAISDAMREESLLLETMGDLLSNTKVGRTTLYNGIKRTLRWGLPALGLWKAGELVRIAP